MACLSGTGAVDVEDEHRPDEGEEEGGGYPSPPSRS